MFNKIFFNPKTRFALIFQPCIIALTGFGIFRAALFFRAVAWNLIDVTFVDLAYIFGQGLIFDIAFISYAILPFVLLLWALPNKWMNTRLIGNLVQVAVFLVLFGLGFCIVAEWLFWEEFGVRFNFISVDYLIYRREVTDNILESYPVFWILSLLVALTLFTFLRLRPSVLKAAAIKEKSLQRTVAALSLLLVAGISFFLIDQSLRDFSDNNYVNELASNGPYQLFAAFKNNTLDYHQFYKTGDDAILSQRLKEAIFEKNGRFYGKGVYNIARTIEPHRPPQQLNIMLITVESLSAKFLTRFGQKKNITPFMDEWFKQGKLFTNFYATGTRTTRGLEAITLSIPPTPGRSIVKRPDNANMYNLGKVFKDRGYDTAFLYGGRGYFDNMNAFFTENGYRIVDQTRLGKDEISFKNAWGVSDEDLYKRAIREAGRAHESKTPFFYHIMTTSNHRPFTFPEGKIDLIPGEGGKGSGRFGAVKYTDYALGRLMGRAQKQPWFKNTIFVVVADHCAASAGKIGLPVEKYHIPLFIYGPAHIKAGEIDRLSSQIDLAPTLLSVLNFPYDSFFFGKNILAPGFKGRALIANYQKLGFLNEETLLFLSPGKTINLVKRGTKNPSLKKIKPTYPFVDELMAYYQGADYVFRNRLNRWIKTN